MSEFIVLSRTYADGLLGDRLISSFKSIGINKSDLNFLTCGEYLVAFSGEKNDFSVRVDGSIVTILGTCLYENKRLLPENLEIGSIQKNVNKLSGRFQILIIKPNEIIIINSIFGTLPCYKYVNSDSVVFSSSLFIIKKILDIGLNKYAVKQKLLYFCNYGPTLVSDVLRLEPASITIFSGHRLSTQCYLSEVISTYKNNSVNKILSKIVARIELNLSAYVDSFDTLSLFFSGGRDSRFLACKLLQLSSPKAIKLLTVGDNEDVEYRIARKYSKNNSLSHELFRPKSMTGKDIDKYACSYAAINFPVQYQVQLDRFLNRKESVFLNSIIPETVLSHLGYFSGDEHSAINFTRNRNTIIKAEYIDGGKDIVKSTEKEVVSYWDSLRAKLPTDSITNIFFENTTYQADWVYTILRPMDRNGKVICIFEDPELISLLGALPPNLLKTDELYEIIIDMTCPELRDELTTRNISKNGIKSLSLGEKFNHRKEIIASIINSASLGYLTKSNADFMKVYLSSNSEMLSDFFKKDYLDSLLSKLKSTNFSDNRLKNFLSRSFGHDFLDEYEMIIPLCAIGIMKNFENEEL